MDYNNLYKKLSTAQTIDDVNISQINVLQYDELQKCDIIDELYRFSKNIDVQRFVLTLFNDKSYLVRSSVYEFCSLIKNKNILTKCINNIEKEHNTIARTYLVSSVNEIAKDIKLETDKYDYLCILSAKEKEISVLIQYINIFFTITNDTKYLYKILEQLNNDDYHLRCVVINSIPDILNTMQKKIVSDCLEKRLAEENSFAVRDLIIKKLMMLAD